MTTPWYSLDEHEKAVSNETPCMSLELLFLAEVDIKQDSSSLKSLEPLHELWMLILMNILVTGPKKYCL